MLPAQLRHRKNAFGDLPSYYSVEREPRTQQQDVAANAALLKLFLNPGDEVAIQSVKDENLYLWNITRRPSRKRQIVLKFAPRAWTSKTSTAVAR